MNDESKLSFSARSSGRYFVSSILIYFRAHLTRRRPLGSDELSLIFFAALKTKASEGSSGGGAIVTCSYCKDHDPTIVVGKLDAFLSS